MTATTKDTGDTLYTALLAAQKDMGPIRKAKTGVIEGKNGGRGYQYKYADLAEVIEVVTDTLTDHGLIFIQPLGILDGQPILTTRIIHAATGDYVESQTPLICRDPTNAQAVGGAITYFRRYSLLSILGLAPEDDDGKKASEAAPPRQRSQPTDSSWMSPEAERHDDGDSYDPTSWSDLWAWLRSKGISGRAALEDKIGGSSQGKTPQQVRAAVEAALKG